LNARGFVFFSAILDLEMRVSLNTKLEEDELVGIALGTGIGPFAAYCFLSYFALEWLIKAANYRINFSMSESGIEF
jgi:hypothetical protein